MSAFTASSPYFLQTKMSRELSVQRFWSSLLDLQQQRMVDKQNLDTCLCRWLWLATVILAWWDSHSASCFSGEGEVLAVLVG